MDDPETILLLTRPEPGSGEFLAACEAALGQRVPAVISPLLSIEWVGDIPPLDAVRTVILTSSNAVERLAEERRLAGLDVVTVGEATAARAREGGAQAVCLGESADQLVARAQEIDAPALHLHGIHTRGDIAARLTAAGCPTVGCAIYDQAARPLSRAAAATLIGTVPVIAPVFSPRTAGLLRSSPVTAPFTLVAMSQAVADAWDGPGAVHVAAAPTRDAMVEATLAALQPRALL